MSMIIATMRIIWYNHARNPIFHVIFNVAHHTQLSTGDSVSHAPNGKLISVTKGVYLGVFSIMFHKALTYAAREAKEATTTLNVLMANVERENLVRMRPDMIAEQLNLSLATVERHLAKLRKLSLIVPDAIERDRKIGITNWRIYPYLSWQGGTNALDAYMAALPSNHVWRTIGS